jgi:flagellar hook assembly protein FlgD
MLGQLVKTLVDEYQSVGYRQVIWDGTNTIGERVGSGIYVYRMSTGQFNASNRMLLIK